MAAIGGSPTCLFHDLLHNECIWIAVGIDGYLPSITFLRSSRAPGGTCCEVQAGRCPAQLVPDKVAPLILQTSIRGCA